jgi:hypothetical protein
MTGDMGGGPLLGEEQAGLGRRKIQNIAHLVLVQGYAVDALCELLRQTHLHFVGSSSKQRASARAGISAILLMGWNFGRREQAWPASARLERGPGPRAFGFRAAGGRRPAEGRFTLAPSRVASVRHRNPPVQHRTLPRPVEPSRDDKIRDKLVFSASRRSGTLVALTDRSPMRSLARGAPVEA